MVASDFRKRAWSALSGKWGTLALITLIYMIVVGALSYTGVGTVLVSGPLTVALSLISLKVIRGEHVAIENLFDGFKNFVNTFLLGLINTIFIFLWSLLLIVPGIIKSLSYSMSYYVMAENPELTQAEARLESMKMMEGNKWRLFCLQFSFIGWILLSVLTLGVLIFWVYPYMQAATAAFYEEIKPKSDELPDIDVADIMNEAHDTAANQDFYHEDITK